MALLLVASVSLLSNLFFRSQFEQYMIRQQETKNKEIVSQAAQQFSQNSSPKSLNSALETVGVSALERGVILRVSDLSGKVLWDATVHNNGFCRQMLQNMAAEMQNRSPNFKGAYEEKTYPLLVGAKKVGSASVGYYGPFYYSANDADFLHMLNRILLGVGLGSLLLAVLLGIYMAGRISSPIGKAITAAENIARGNYRDPIPAGSGTLELDRLTASINRLSGELERQEALRRRLTADVAHELRTPLAALQGYMEALIDGIWEPDRERLESCHEEVLRLTRLVSDLERLAQMEGENAELNLETVDLKELAGKAVKSFEAELMKKQISAGVSGDSVKVPADPDKISRVFVNLISNSLNYTPAGGSIRITIGERDGAVVAEVADTGSGIAAEDLPYIFERFYRTDKSRSSRSGGAGIGLTLVRTIVEMHRGRVTVESEVGQGTTFRVFLPLCRAEREEA